MVSAPLAAVGTAPTWAACRSCRVPVYLPKLARTLYVCPECNRPQRIGAAERLQQLVDGDTFRIAAARVTSVDPLGFVDSRPYRDRVAEARRRTGHPEAVVWGRAAIGGHPVVVAAMDFAFMGASMGSAVGESVTRAAEEALATRTPLVLVVASGGARMQEGCLSLMQMAKTSQAVRRLQRHGVLSACVLTDPTFGGVTASFATLTDILVGEQGSLIGFAGPRVIAAATRERLPEGFQTAEYLYSRGLLDRVEPRDAIRPLLARILALATGKLDGGKLDGGAVPAPEGRSTAEVYKRQTAGAAAWDAVRAARDVRRPTTMDYISLMADDFVELHGDRCHGDDSAIVGGLASLDGVPVMLIGHQKGHDTPELVARHFGMPHPEGYRKAARLMRLADRLGLPVVTLIDTPGAAPGIGAEERGQAWAIAESIAQMGELGVPTVAVVTGEGGSGGALALAVGNRVLMLEHAVYSVISPESCSAILYGDASRAAEMAAALMLTTADLVRLGVVDGVVAEPPGGAPAAHPDAARNLQVAILDAVRELAGLSPDELRAHRRERFRGLGAYADA